MPNDQVFKTLGEDVLQKIDFGDLSSEWAGQTIEIRVNPPGIIADFAGKKLAEMSRDNLVQVIDLFTRDERMKPQPERIARLPDTVLFWLAGECLNRYNEYTEELEKNSKAR